MSNNLTAQELRIGNFYEVDGTIYRVVSISENSFSGVVVKPVKGMHTNGGKRCPIELSEEVLIKCGFKEIENGWFPYWEIKHTRSNELVEFVFKISTIGDGEWRWLEGNANIPFYYLHQLQNLYFCLCGTELNYIP